MKSNGLCDEFGLDTISCGDVVAAYLAANDEFGNSELIHEMVEKITYREDEGDLLAERIDRFHEALGIENWTVKGLEFPAHNGWTLHGQGLGFAVANRGADHMYATFYAFEYPLVNKDRAFVPDGLEDIPAKLVEAENRRALEDCGVVCRFSRDFMTPERFEGLFETDFAELLAIGGTVIDLERHFNNKRGFTRTDDTLPYELPDFEHALDTYYDEREWAHDGTVSERSLVSDD